MLPENQEPCESPESPESLESLSRAGATLDLSNSEVDFDTIDSLPMVTWLRGDEAYAGAFCLTAEDVMKELGIKRSRLTQISGRELRVGRQRVDRYVRPMYRPVDVATYKNWTRATATHQKASTMIEEAAVNLASKATAVEQVIQDFSQQFQDLIVASIKSEINSLSQDIKEQIEAVKGSFGEALVQATANMTAPVVDVLSKVNEMSLKGEERVGKISASLEQLRAKVESMTTLMMNISELVLQGSERQETNTMETECRLIDHFDAKVQKLEDLIHTLKKQPAKFIRKMSLKPLKRQPIKSSLKSSLTRSSANVRRPRKKSLRTNRFFKG